MRIWLEEDDYIGKPPMECAPPPGWKSIVNSDLSLEVHLAPCVQCKIADFVEIDSGFAASRIVCRDCGNHAVHNSWKEAVIKWNGMWEINNEQNYP